MGAMSDIKTKWAEKTGRLQPDNGGRNDGQSNRQTAVRSHEQHQTEVLDEAMTRPYSLLRENQGSAPALSFYSGKSRHSFPYMTLMRLELNQQGELELWFSGGRVIVQGRQLQPLYEDIHRYKVTHIWVGGNDLPPKSPQPESFNRATCIDAIIIELNDALLTP